VPSLRAVWKEAAETSIRAPIGRDAKRGEEEPSNVDTGEGSGARTDRKRVFGVDADWPTGVVAEDGMESWGVRTSEGLRIVLATESGVEVIKTSFQPWCVFWEEKEDINLTDSMQ
jgi:hypothetical protein